MAKVYFNEERFRSLLANLEKKVDVSIFNHPFFRDGLRNSIYNIEKYTGSDIYSFSVSDDGKKVFIITELPYNGSLGLQENYNFMQTEFSLSYDNELIVNDGRGTVYYVDDVVRKYPDCNLYDGHKYLVESKYEQRIFDASGIQLSYSIYYDAMPFDGNFRRKDLSRYVNEILCPKMEYGEFPLAPKLAYNARAETFYRDYDNLGLVSHAAASGLNGENKTSVPSLLDIHILNSEFPEFICTNGPVASWSFSEKKYIFNGIISGIENYDDLYNYCKQAFEIGLEISKTKQRNSKVLDALSCYSKKSR